MCLYPTNRKIPAWEFLLLRERKGERVIELAKGLKRAKGSKIRRRTLIRSSKRKVILGLNLLYVIKGSMYFLEMSQINSFDRVSASKTLQSRGKSWHVIRTWLFLSAFLFLLSLFTIHFFDIVGATREVSLRSASRMYFCFRCTPS